MVEIAGKPFTQLTNLNILDEFRYRNEFLVGEREVGRFSTSDTQNPTGLGDANKIRVNYGPGGNTTGNEFTVAADGLITTNIGDVQYRIDLNLRLGRLGAGGVSEILGRLMYAADGIEGNAVQSGSTFAVEIDNANAIFPERFDLAFTPATGSVFWVELARNNGSNDSGGLLTFTPAGDLSGWTIPTTAQIIFSRMIQTG